MRRSECSGHASAPQPPQLLLLLFAVSAGWPAPGAPGNARLVATRRRRVPSSLRTQRGFSGGAGPRFGGCGRPRPRRRVTCADKLTTLAAQYVDFQDVWTSDPLGTFHAKQLTAIADCLESDGVGVIPTDTVNAYVTSIDSPRGVRRIYDLKGIAPDERKPLSLLCADISMAARYADTGAIPRRWFQAMRQCLPGPFTFILRATRAVPRMVLEHKSRKRLWRRREVGIRVPDCAVVQHLTTMLEAPLLSSSADGAISELWSQQANQLDFLVHGMDVSLWDDSGLCDRVSTIVDLTMEKPVLRRQGSGDASSLVGEDAVPLVT